MDHHQIVRLVELGATGQEMAVPRRPVKGPDRHHARLARRPTLLVPQHERLDDRGRPLQGGARLGLQVDALPTAHLVFGSRVPREPGHLQGERRVGVRPGGGEIEGEPQVVPGGLLGQGHGGGETRAAGETPVRRGVQGPRESGEYL